MNRSKLDVYFTSELQIWGANGSRDQTWVSHFMLLGEDYATKLGWIFGVGGSTQSSNLGKISIFQYMCNESTGFFFLYVIQCWGSVEIG